MHCKSFIFSKKHILVVFLFVAYCQGHFDRKQISESLKRRISFGTQNIQNTKIINIPKKRPVIDYNRDCRYFLCGDSVDHMDLRFLKTNFSITSKKHHIYIPRDLKSKTYILGWACKTLPGEEWSNITKLDINIDTSNKKTPIYTVLGKTDEKKEAAFHLYYKIEDYIDYVHPEYKYNSTLGFKKSIEKIFMDIITYYQDNQLFVGRDVLRGIILQQYPSIKNISCNFYYTVEQTSNPLSRMRMGYKQSRPLLRVRHSWGYQDR